MYEDNFNKYLYVYKIYLNIYLIYLNIYILIYLNIFKIAKEKKEKIYM